MTAIGNFAFGEVLPSSTINALPAGIAGYASTGSSQTGITTITDLTSLSVNLTAIAGRRYLIMGSVNFRQRTSAAGVAIYIRNGSTTLASSLDSMTTDAYGSTVVFWVDTPGAGSVTYKLSASTGGGSVDVNPQGLSTVPSAIFVFDVGST